MKLLHALSSLWFAVLLLMLLLVALACATVYESVAGTEQALNEFYHARWFALFLALFSVNIIAAVVVRFPINRHRIGFFLTHAGLIVILAGALITMGFGLDGKIGITEGKKTDEFRLRDVESITLTDRFGGTQAHVDLRRGFLSSSRIPDLGKTGPLVLGSVTAKVLRYIPDSDFAERVVDDNPFVRPAVEVTLADDHRADSRWIFANRRERVGPLLVTFSSATTVSELQRLLAPKPSGESEGTITVRLDEIDRELSLRDCLAARIPLEGTPYTVHAIRYLPHATVGADNQIVNASNQPVNPAIEVEIAGPDGKDVRWAFAKFPDFKSMHGEKQHDDIAVTFTAPDKTGPRAPIEIMAGPKGETYVRFTHGDNVLDPVKLVPGVAVDTPWASRRLTVQRRFDHARIAHDVTPVEPAREERTPAVELELTTNSDSSKLWVQKNRITKLTSDGTPFEILFTDKAVPLGYELTLNRFRVGYYPGTSRPRSFESHVTITDNANGARFDRVVSMNHPTKYGPFTIYQSSYRLDGPRPVSFLSVAHDPGQPVVFAGYFMTITGMIVVLVIRMRQRAHVPVSVTSRALPVIASSNGRMRAPVGGPRIPSHTVATTRRQESAGLTTTSSGANGA